MSQPFKTRITDLLGIEHPLIGGTMMHLSKAELTAAISEGGGLGILASANFPDMGELREQLQETRRRTAKPFSVNLNFFPMLAPVPAEKVMEVCLEEGVRLFESSGHSAPDPVVKRIHEAGGVLVHKCAGVRYARKAASLGVDGVTVVGWENGGAMGMLDVSTLALVPRVVEELDLPVVGGGGVGDGRGFLALLALGAEGVIMGTRFLLAEECPIHPRIKEALCNASELDTVPIMRSIRATHRAWSNEASRNVVKLEQEMTGPDGIAEDQGKMLTALMPYVAGHNAQEMYRTGDVDKGILCIGQGIGQMREVMPAADIVRQVVAEAAEIRDRLVGMGT